MKILAIILDFVTILFALFTWLNLPQEVPVHFDLLMHPDRYGDKAELLILVLFPLFGLIPWRTKEAEYHSTDEETLKKAAEEHKKAVFKSEIGQILTSLLICAALYLLFSLLLQNR